MAKRSMFYPLRKLLGTAWNIKVLVIEGEQKPAIYCFRTQGRKWRDRHIVVGSGWLIEYMPEVFAEMIAKRMIGR